MMTAIRTWLGMACRPEYPNDGAIDGIEVAHRKRLVLPPDADMRRVMREVADELDVLAACLRTASKGE